MRMIRKITAQVWPNILSMELMNHSKREQVQFNFTTIYKTFTVL